MTLIRKALGGELLPYMLEYVLYVMSALAVGFVMAKAIETPFLRLRDRWFPSRAMTLAVSAGDNQSMKLREPVKDLARSP